MEESSLAAAIFFIHFVCPTLIAAEIIIGFFLLLLVLLLRVELSSSLEEGRNVSSEIVEYSYGAHSDDSITTTC